MSVLNAPLHDPAAPAPSAHAAAAPTPRAALDPSLDHGVPVHGNPRLLLHHNFRSAFLPAPRNIIVALPPGYHEAATHYPVLYLHDGQNLFDPDTSFVHGCYWRVQETSDRLIAEGLIQPLIVVGVYNTGVDRLEEYTPMPDRNLGGGKGGLYSRLLIEELKPWLDSRYRTLDGPANTGLGGSSLGGLITLSIGLSAPQVFGRLAVLSPSVWWAGGAILPIVRAAHPASRPRIWLDMGLGEGSMMVQRCDQLNRTLVASGWHPGTDLLYTRVDGAKHSEDAWAQRVDPFLRFLFPA